MSEYIQQELPLPFPELSADLPLVGRTDWERTEGITNLKLLDETKVRLGSSCLYTQDVNLDRQSLVKFQDINIGKIVDHYSALMLWPRELVFRASLDPAKDESDLANNVFEKILLLDPPD